VSNSHGGSHIRGDKRGEMRGGDSSAVASVAIDGPLSFNF
jgi:hypothetical protein